MEYKLITKEYVKFLKSKKDVTYSINADSITEAVDKLYGARPETGLRTYGWTKEQIRGNLELNNPQETFQAEYLQEKADEIRQGLREDGINA